MTRRVLLDTGPLVAFLNRRDRYHPWAVAQFGSIEPPLLTCEAVLSEACFLLRHSSDGAEKVIELLRRDLVSAPFRIEDETDDLARLAKRYADVPVALADACLVRMSELYSDAVVLTLDDDFRIYRKHTREVIPLITPPVRKTR